MNDISLTFVIPVYNTENYLLRCLDSVNISNVKIIVVDDGSFDNSPKILDDYAEKHKNCKVIHTNNQGVVAARIEGLKCVDTEYFAFIDSDDFINIGAYIKLCESMKYYKYPVGTGRASVYFPSLNIPINSRKWKKYHLDFSKDKREFSNTICPLWGKVWHISCAHYFMEKSEQYVYEDLEVVYHALAKQRYMFHTNDLIYNYCVRKNSTSSIGLERTTNKGVKGLLNATTSMKEKFLASGMYDEYEQELNSITIKLFFQRIRAIITNKSISNKKEMLELMLNILDNYIPEWRSNKYYLEGFKGSEYDDSIYFKYAMIILKCLRIFDNYEHIEEDYKELLESYNRKIVLK